MRHPGLEPGSTDWKSVIIPLDQWRCVITAPFPEKRGPLLNVDSAEQDKKRYQRDSNPRGQVQ